MSQRLFLKRPLFLIVMTFCIGLVLLFLLFGLKQLESKISEKMVEISTKDILQMVHNQASVIENKFKHNGNYVQQLEQNQSLQKEVESLLNALLTSNIKYAYMIYKDKQDVFRFIADGAMQDKAFMHQKFDVDSNSWFEVFEHQRPLMIEHTVLKQLFITYLIPFVYENEVKLILAIDFSISKVDDIEQIISFMKNGLFTIIIIIAIFLLVLIVQAIRYVAMRKSAFMDKLTKVYNRNYLQEFENFINLNDYILATLDIDFFKLVNDTYGHDAGDKILKEVANTILQSIRNKDDIIIRYGGEEFVVLAKIKRDDNISAINVIERIFKNIQNKRFYINEEDYLNITVSIGINLVPNKSRTFQEAFKLADQALYSAKNRGRNRIEIYDETLKGASNSDMMSLNEIKQAIEENRVICYYQKIINTQTKELSHYEALLRIVSKTGEIITPNRILPVIEGTFILRNITKSVLNICYEKLLSNPHIRISVNLNPQDLVNDTILEILKSYAKTKNIAQRLGLEIVESDDLIHNKNAKRNILKLKRFGYKIYIDDFGSGYSNFIYLSEIKTDCIKIDGTIIKKILDDKMSYLLVKHVVNFAKDANIKVIAEYVSSKEIYEQVKLLGIEYSQGFYFSKPQPFE
jgi:diguanylate cyclase (GGDEF)-like protein